MMILLTVREVMFVFVNDLVQTLSRNQFNLPLGDQFALLFVINNPEVEIGKVYLFVKVLLIQILEHVRREAVLDSIFLGQDEGRLNGPGFKEVGMIAHFPELHEDTHDTEEVAVSEDVLSLVLIDVFIVQQPLSP